MLLLPFSTASSYAYAAYASLLALEVVRLDYSGHIATAVRFSRAMSGDYLTIDNRTFTICAPTYIGARIGMAMDDFKQTKAKVIFID